MLGKKSLSNPAAVIVMHFSFPSHIPLTGITSSSRLIAADRLSSLSELTSLLLDASHNLWCWAAVVFYNTARAQPPFPLELELQMFYISANFHCIHYQLP